ncbi:hypothetical protein MPTK1_2g12810 [Marchantia polymorpha subsp. ruderalis]|uniref:Uncharacterized protein n=1 Tax=Marchantia polymorpha TaxID=3197 RepID=A0A2R6XAV8_MARPO|nr:hypothetical protein MARPO_0026s0091 [Marchantia polymorpha]BBN02102.1 hypothetical protein Mp_2g12810 [Marchantia polymorpha subsp. ruderalis]|eukprot:PTQ43218.1 hypothetical protein MARPO_0026s0091 [Marchantia polymorpha]
MTTSLEKLATTASASAFRKPTRGLRRRFRYSFDQNVNQNSLASAKVFIVSVKPVRSCIHHLCRKLSPRHLRLWSDSSLATVSQRNQQYPTIATADESRSTISDLAERSLRDVVIHLVLVRLTTTKRH